MELSIAKPIVDILIQLNDNATFAGQTIDQVLSEVSQELVHGSNEPGLTYIFTLLKTFGNF